MSENRLSSSIQESILTALCFNNDEIKAALPIITADLFEGVYGDIAERVLDYRNRYGSAPGSAHIDDLFSDILGDTSHQQHQTYNRLIVGMLEQYDNGFNVSYVVSKASDFARRQLLKQGVVEAGLRYQEGGEEVAEDVERILQDTLNKHIKSIDPGTFLGDTDRVLRFLDRSEDDYCKVGIKELDKNGIYPVKKQLFAFLAPYKRGKSFFLTHVGKMALLQGWSVAEATLEMSEELKCERYVQSLYSISRRDESFTRSSIITDPLGRIIDLVHQKHKAKMSFEDPLTRKRIVQKISNPSWNRKLNKLVVKEFPTGSLTVKDLESWLDMLEATHKFIPDLVMVDYPGIMNLGETKYHRLNLGRTLVDLRGLAVRRNVAVVIPHQVNRAGAKAQNVRGTDAAEDISLIAICDNAVTYSQTEQEHKMGLARLWVDRARSEKDRYGILISQSYPSGQFFLESAPLSKQYTEMVKAKAEEIDDGDDDYEDDDE